MSYKIAIDGPAGAGKSTIAKIFSKKMGFVYVDTGAMYRAMALYMLDAGIDVNDKDAVSDNCTNADITIKYENNEQVVYLNGENVNKKIREERVGNAASSVAKIEKVRSYLVSLQHKIAQTTDVVMDGRDIGTVVMPDADLKIFLTADPAVRAKRRFDELVSKGESPDLEKIKEDIILRDKQDMEREISPLKKADDAIELDSSYLGIEEVSEEISKLFEQKVKG